MKIVVTVSELQAEIDKALKDYDKEYQKLLSLYFTKLKKYVVYIKKQSARVISNKKPQQFKSPPHPPSWLRDNFIQITEALKAHTNPTVEMDDREYDDIRKGMERLRENVRTTTAMLNEIRY